MPSTNEPAVKAINKAGGPRALAAKLLGGKASDAEMLKMQSRISKWRYNGIPPRWVLAVEAASGVPRHKLAPLLYPREQERA